MALRVPGVDVHDVIQVHRRYLVELMQQWTRLKEDEADFDLELRAGRRRRAVPARLGRPLARRRRRSAQAGGGSTTQRSAAAPFALPKAAAEGGSAAMSVLELRQRLQGLRRGGDRGARARRRRPLGRRRRARRGDGAERIGQEHAADDRRQPRGTDQRRGAVDGHVAVGDVAQRQGPAAAALDRLRVPGLQPAGRAHRGRRTSRCRSSSTASRPGRPSAAGHAQRSRSSASPTGPTTTPTSSPAASASGSRSPGPWSASATCCWPTSRRARSTRRTARR